MKKLHSLVVKGKHETWSFGVFVDPKYLDQWREDGLEIDEIINTVPEYIVDLGLMRFWFFLQDLWNFKWLFWLINKFKKTLQERI